MDRSWRVRDSVSRAPKSAVGDIGVDDDRFALARQLVDEAECAVHSQWQAFEVGDLGARSLQFAGLASAFNAVSHGRLHPPERGDHLFGGDRFGLDSRMATSVMELAMSRISWARRAINL
jgi:hypothetical protein